MKITWTPEAKESYNELIENLNIYWTDKEITKFINQTEHTILLIQSNPYMFKVLEQNRNIRKGFVNKLVSMYYRINTQKQTILIVLFLNNRQNLDNIKLTY